MTERQIGQLIRYVSGKFWWQADSVTQHSQSKQITQWFLKGHIVSVPISGRSSLPSGNDEGLRCPSAAVGI